ncbi:hypothetical protein CMI47_03405 [Candidatus Pacearchaeota archaeon]|nr:hypothetical protein [Candidatus Pacearchaeota archaeon]|tara:strand:+ start:3963 stop:4538 length:576 start_codon:yes stop_codon:yes gene_type:complete
MQIDKKEVSHRIALFNQIKEALEKKDPLKLKDLSNHTIHTASTIQDPTSITIAVIIYTLSKLIERDDYKKISSWETFTKKFNLYLDGAIAALKQNNENKYKDKLTEARKSIESVSPNLKKYIKEVLRKAAINKASKLYEHGLSLEQTSKLLGITQWELSEYTGQKDVPESKLNKTLTVKQRAKMALEFFEK